MVWLKVKDEVLESVQRKMKEAMEAFLSGKPYRGDLVNLYTNLIHNDGELTTGGIKDGEIPVQVGLKGYSIRHEGWVAKDRFLDDLNDAWLLVEEMREKGYFTNLETLKGQCRFGFYPEGETVVREGIPYLVEEQTYGDTAQEAIVRAYLMWRTREGQPQKTELAEGT